VPSAFIWPPSIPVTPVLARQTRWRYQVADLIAFGNITGEDGRKAMVKAANAVTGRLARLACAAEFGRELSLGI